MKASASKKRREYQHFSSEKKAMIAKYASENRVSRALRHFSDKNLKESTVRDWVKVYRLELDNISKMPLLDGVDDVMVKSLPSKPRGRPPILGVKLD
jgi:hypothetical protein